MEFIITVKETDGRTTKHPVISFNLIQGIEDFCQDYGYQLTDIKTIVVIDQ